jgi:mono/diheme cytochrome c family protein
MPKHGVRLILLVAVFLTMAATAKSYFTPDSFYRYGHYRADAVHEIAAGTPKHQSADSCQSCHADGYVEWSAGVHTVVECEVCHGAAGKHPDTGTLPIPADSVKLCTLCHEAMPARPAAQPQIVVEEHAGEQQCVACHNPHSPGFGAPSGGAVTAEALSEQCAGCHGDDGLGGEDSPPLAGKDADYLARQLHDYRSGTREDAMMNMIAETLSEQDIDALATHYGSLRTEIAK